MLQFIKYLARFSGVSLLIRSVNPLIHAQVRLSVTSVLTQLLRRNLPPCHIIALATLLLARLLVGILTKRWHVRLAGALAFSGTALMVLAIRLDPPSERSTREGSETEKDQGDAPAVEGSPVAISHSSENVPVDLSVFPVRNPFPSAR